MAIKSYKKNYTRKTRNKNSKRQNRKTRNKNNKRQNRKTRNKNSKRQTKKYGGNNPSGQSLDPNEVSKHAAEMLEKMKHIRSKLKPEKNQQGNQQGTQQEGNNPQQPEGEGTQQKGNNSISLEDAKERLDKRTDPVYLAALINQFEVMMENNNLSEEEKNIIREMLDKILKLMENNKTKGGMLKITGIGFGKNKSAKSKKKSKEGSGEIASDYISILEAIKAYHRVHKEFPPDINPLLAKVVKNGGQDIKGMFGDGVYNWKTISDLLKIQDIEKIDEEKFKNIVELSKALALKLPKGAAEVAKGAAEVAEGAAEVAKGAAEVAEGAAEVAKGAAEVAEGAAKTGKLVQIGDSYYESGPLTKFVSENSGKINKLSDMFGTLERIKEEIVENINTSINGIPYNGIKGQMKTSVFSFNEEQRTNIKKALKQMEQSAPQQEKIDIDGIFKDVDKFNVIKEIKDGFEGMGDINISDMMGVIDKLNIDNVIKITRIAPEQIKAIFTNSKNILDLLNEKGKVFKILQPEQLDTIIRELPNMVGEIPEGLGNMLEFATVGAQTVSVLGQLICGFASMSL